MFKTFNSYALFAFSHIRKPGLYSIVFLIYVFPSHIRKSGLFSTVLLFWKLCTNIINIRPNTTDVDLFSDVFLEKDFSLGFLDLHPQTIIDAGANVGYTSIFFTIAYPHAKIFAIEPEESNFEMLRRNVKYFRNIIPINAALWNKKEELQILDPGKGKWGFQTIKSNEEKKSGKVNTITVDRLIDLHKINTIDVFKINIEGAEKELFSSNFEWLVKTNVIIIELHDRFRDGCTKELNNATKAYKFSRKKRKSYTILFKTTNNLER
jgi:FkbM family methyltransferase